MRSRFFRSVSPLFEGGESGLGRRGKSGSLPHIKKKRALRLFLFLT